MDLSTTNGLLGAYGVIDRPRAFLRDLFFPTRMTSEDEEVHFDRLERSRRLAPFVAPTVAGKVMRQRGFNTLTFKPPYVKPKGVIVPDKMQKRIAGEALTGELTPEARRDRKALELLQEQDDEITRREEWMCSQMLRTGSVVCTGEDFPAMTVDMQRTANHTVALTLGARWGESGVDPYNDLKTWAERVQNNSGFHPEIVVVDPLAGSLLAASPKLQAERAAFNFPAAATLDGLGRTAGGIGREAKYLGRTPEFEVWQYQQLYKDSAGNTQKFMPDYTVIMGAPEAAGGAVLYGAILDVAALQAMERFPKRWIENDPPVEYLMTQAAPVPALGWADATLAATVR